jgi:transposase-like protein
MRYSWGFKASVVQKAVDGSGRSIAQLARETGVSAITITSWIAKHKTGKLIIDSSMGMTPEQRVPGEKLSLLLESRNLTEEHRGEWLRQHGMHSEHLALWEQELTSLMNDTQTNLKVENQELKKDNKRLKKELERSRAALAEAAILLTIKKNYPTLFSESEDD